MSNERRDFNRRNIGYTIPILYQEGSRANTPHHTVYRTPSQ